MKSIDPKASEFIDHDALEGEMHPDAHQYVDGYEAAAPEADIPMSAADAFVTQAIVQGPLNFGDEIGGGVRAGAETASNYLGDAVNKLRGKPVQPHEDFMTLYKTYRDALRMASEEAEKQHPNASFAGGMFGGAAMLPAGAVAALGGPLVKGASMGAKMLHGARVGAAIGAANGVGVTQDINQPVQVAKDAIEHAGAGATLGAFMPPIAATAKATAVGTADLGKFIGSKIFGPVKQAFEIGKNGEMVVGKAGANKAGEEISNFSKEVAPNIKNNLDRLAQVYNKIVKQADLRGQKLDLDTIHQTIDKALTTDAVSRNPQASRELQELKDLLLNYTQGKEVDKVNRVFFGDRETQLKKFQDMFKAKQLANQINTVEPQAPTDMQDFEHAAKIKSMEQEMIPGAQSPVEMQTEFQPTGRDGEVLGVLKQPQFTEDGNFNGYKKVMSDTLQTKPAPAEEPWEMIMEKTDDPNKILVMERQPVMKDGKVVGYNKGRQKLIPAEEAAKFQDVTQTVRENPANMEKFGDVEQLRQDVKDKSRWGENRFETRDAVDTASKLANELRDTMRQSLPQLKTVNTAEANLKKAADSIGITDTKDLNEQGIMRKIISMINQQRKTNSSGIATREQIDQFIGHMKNFNPQLGQKIEDNFNKLSSKLDVIEESNKKWHFFSPLSTIRAISTGASNYAGYKLGQISALPKEHLGYIAHDIATNRVGKAAEIVGNTLNQALQKDDRGKNAILFGLMQNPAYREILNEYLSDDKEEAK